MIHVCVYVWERVCARADLCFKESNFLLQFFDDTVPLLNHHSWVLQLCEEKAWVWLCLYIKKCQIRCHWSRYDFFFFFTCSIICLSFLCWLLSISSRWCIFSLRMAFSFSKSSNLHKVQWPLIHRKLYKHQTLTGALLQCPLRTRL